MKKSIVLFLIINLVLCKTYMLSASECYHYHTPNYYELFVKNNKIVFQHTIKDPNGVSYVSQEKVALENIRSQGFKILSENDVAILFSSIDGYFVAYKNISELRGYGVRKIGNFEDINESIGVNFFCVNNQWKYIVAGHYTHNNIEKVVVDMPNDLTMITDLTSRKILFKNLESVFYLDIENLTFHKIEGLNGKHTRFFRFRNRYRSADAFLYDEDTFYRISVHNIEDFTSEFTKQQKNISFKNLKISQKDDNISLDTGDGAIWLYKESGLLYELDKNVSMHFISKKASYLNGYNEFILFNSKVYNDFYDLVKNYKGIDFSLVKNKEEFRKESGFFYTDGLHKYHYDYESKMMKPISWLAGSDQFYPQIDTYSYLGNNRCYIGATKIHALFPGEKAEGKSISYDSEIKDLGLAIAYDDKIRIENKEVSNIADSATISFLGSTVDVISGCDGGEGQYPVEIDVYYFFKDKDNIYVYSTQNPKMRVIKNVNVLDYKEDNYDQLMYLMKRSMKSKKK